MSDFLIGLITVLVYVAVVVTWFFCLFDLFFRSMSGWAKAGWLLAIVFVPLFGVIAYLVTRPRQPVTELWVRPEESEGLYAQRDDGVAKRVETLARLREAGTISDEEFTRLSEKAIQGAA